MDFVNFSHKFTRIEWIVSAAGDILLFTVPKVYVMNQV